MPRTVEVDPLRHVEADTAQHGRDGAGVVDRVGERRGVHIGGVADHQRNAAPG